MITRIPSNKYEPNPNCKWCHGQGWVWVTNGKDDVDKDPCICLDYEQDKVKRAISNLIKKLKGE
jgi:hypothetical protein